MPSKYRAFKEAADRIVELERDLAAALERAERAEAVQLSAKETINTLRGVRDRLVAERDANRRDAERYRWFRVKGEAEMLTGDVSADELDAAIDAAIAEGKPAEKAPG